jgi:hypothetical protein
VEKKIEIFNLFYTYVEICGIITSTMERLMFGIVTLLLVAAAGFGTRPEVIEDSENHALSRNRRYYGAQAGLDVSISVCQ